MPTRKQSDPVRSSVKKADAARNRTGPERLKSRNNDNRRDRDDSRGTKSHNDRDQNRSTGRQAGRKN